MASMYRAFLMLFATICLAEEAHKPVCNAQTHGQFWPAEANVSRTAAQDFNKQGLLEMCSYSVWKYKWQLLSVNAQAKAAGARAHEHGENTPASEPQSQQK